MYTHSISFTHTIAHTCTLAITLPQDLPTQDRLQQRADNPEARLGLCAMPCGSQRRGGAGAPAVGLGDPSSPHTTQPFHFPCLSPKSS